MRIPIVGGSYVSRSPNADCERAVNLYPEIVESGNGKSKAVLLGTPGRAFYRALASGPCRGFAWGTVPYAFWGGRPIDVYLAIGGSTLYNWNPFVEGISPLAIGDIGAPPSPPQIVCNGTHFLIGNGSQPYLSDGYTLTPLAGFPVTPWVQGQPYRIAYLDGYFVAADCAARKIYISGLYDGTSWDPLEFSVQEGSFDKIVTLFADHHELWVLGSQRCALWYNSGNADFPFEPISGAVVEYGCGAKDAVSKLDNSVFFLATSDRGGTCAVRLNGYTPVRISTHAVEYAWSQYATIADAVAYAYEDHGHAFWVIHFPTGDATWVYDVKTGLWHERGLWDGANYHCEPARFHQSVAGVGHLVGDYRSGNIYLQSTKYLDDGGTPIRRLRRTPHISEEMKWMRHDQLLVDAQPGVDATFGMKFSDDGGQTWSHEYTDQTVAAETKSRVKWRRLGRSRDRVYDIYTESRAPIAIVDGYAEIQAGLGS